MCSLQKGCMYSHKIISMFSCRMSGMLETLCSGKGNLMNLYHLIVSFLVIPCYSFNFGFQEKRPCPVCKQQVKRKHLSRIYFHD